jgi:uncharacterized paraquat-inducible protein A
LKRLPGSAGLLSSIGLAVIAKGRAKESRGRVKRIVIDVSWIGRRIWLLEELFVILISRASINFGKLWVFIYL